MNDSNNNASMGTLKSRLRAFIETTVSNKLTNSCDVKKTLTYDVTIILNEMKIEKKNENCT